MQMFLQGERDTFHSNNLCPEFPCVSGIWVWILLSMVMGDQEKTLPMENMEMWHSFMMEEQQILQAHPHSFTSQLCCNLHWFQTPYI